MPKPKTENPNQSPPFDQLFKDSEARLLRLGEWVIFAVQALGYLPLSINKKREALEWKRISFPVIINIGLIMASLLWVFFYQGLMIRGAAKAGLSGDTEMLAFTASCYITSLVGTLFRLQACYRVKRVLGFWHENCHFMASFSSLSPRLELSQYRKMFGWGVNFRAGILKHVILALSQCLGYAITGAFTFSPEDSSEGVFSKLLPLSFYILCALWSLMICLHVLSSFCIVFFIKIYTSCLNVVSHNLEQLYGDSVGEPELNAKHFRPLSIGSSLITGPPSSIENSKPPTKDEDTGSTVESCILAYELIEKQIGSYNAFFGMQTIFQILIDILSLVIYVFFLMLHLGSGLSSRIFSDVIPIIAMSWDLHHLSSDATYLTLASKGVLDQVHRIQLHELSSKLRYKVQLLALRISTRPITVSPGNYFDLSRTIIASILSVMTTYLVVMVQFRSADRIKS